MENIDAIVEICKILDKNKAGNIIVIDTSKRANIVNFFVLATATSVTHIKSIIDKCYEEIANKEIFKVNSREGFNTSKWQVLDVGEGFIHIFLKEEREKYNLEKLLGEGGNISSFDKLLKMQKKMKALQMKKEKQLNKKNEVKPKEKKLANKLDEIRKKKIDKELSKIHKGKKQ